MTEYNTEPHTAICTGQMGCGKTHPVLQSSLEKNTINLLTLQLFSPQHCEKILPIMLRSGSKTMIKFGLWILKAISINRLKKLSELLQFLEVLFIIDDIIANKDLDKRSQSLLKLSVSGRHRGYYLWILTQSYKGIPKKFEGTG